MDHKIARLKQHFTEASDIKTLMCELLGSVDGFSLLEPAVGHGAFFGDLRGRPERIDIVDIDPLALDVASHRFAHLPIKRYCTDFVDMFIGDMFQDSHPVRYAKYDAVISNPPYGLYFPPAYRKRLKQQYPDLYVRESYGLFFVFSLNLLRDNGRYVFLLPDTFLASRNHSSLRSFICSNGAPTHIVRFPSKRFETVQFGYGNLCIIAGNRRVLQHADSVQWLDVFGANEPLSVEKISRGPTVSGAQLLGSAEAGWSSTSLKGATEFAGNFGTLGASAECRTGIYSGDNSRFIGYDASRVRRRLNGHAISTDQLVDPISLSESHRLSGINGEKRYVPLVRGGHRDAFERTPWAIDWSTEAIAFYRNDKKARFQNSKFYFLSGLSVPMVTTRRISAALMTNAVFDQGVVGVFPFDITLIPALLLYLNSTTASRLMKGITNGSANNSANYLKRLPIPNFRPNDIKQANRIVDFARQNGSLDHAICEQFTQQIMATHHRR